MQKECQLVVEGDEYNWVLCMHTCMCISLCECMCISSLFVCLSVSVSVCLSLSISLSLPPLAWSMDEWARSRDRDQLNGDTLDISAVSHCTSLTHATHTHTHTHTRTLTHTGLLRWTGGTGSRCSSRLHKGWKTGSDNQGCSENNVQNSWQGLWLCHGRIHEAEYSRENG